MGILTTIGTNIKAILGIIVAILLAIIYFFVKGKLDENESLKKDNHVLKTNIKTQEEVIEDSRNMVEFERKLSKQELEITKDSIKDLDNINSNIENGRLKI